MFVSTIIVAAGRGKRFGAKKQFFNLCGRPVIEWSIEKFSDFSDEIIVVLEKSDFGRLNPAQCGIKIVAGGKQRYDSVMSGLENVSPFSKVICIHDGARPLVAKKDISRCINGAVKYGAALCAAPASDTIKYSEDGFVERTIDRNKIFLVQTPQAFRKEIILGAYESMPKTKLKSVTDDAMVVEAYGGKVKIIETDSSNIKITRREDIAIAEALLCRKKLK